MTSPVALRAFTSQGVGLKSLIVRCLRSSAYWRLPVRTWRREMKSQQRRVLITGATGLVGSFLAERLLRDGHTVFCLARSKRDLMPQERVHAALHEVNRNLLRARLQVVPGDVEKLNAGVAAHDVGALTGSIDELWHCAALTSFGDRYRDEIWSTNADGTDNVIALASHLRVRRFYFTSTAYVSDQKTAEATERLVNGRTQFRNTYERSKSWGEHAVASSGLSHNIFRLPIMTGRREDGLVRQYLGYYTFARSVHRLRTRIMAALEDTASRSRLHREHIYASESPCEDAILSMPTLHLPVRVHCNPEATLNLLPIDMVIDTIVRCSNAGAPSGTILHVTNGTPPKLRSLIDLAMSSLGIKDHQVTPIVVDRSGKPSPSIEACDRMMRSQLSNYMPYMFGEPRFSRDKLAALIGETELPDFVFTPAYVRSIFEYAVNMDWNST